MVCWDRVNREASYVLWKSFSQPLLILRQSLSKDNTPPMTVIRKRNRREEQREQQFWLGRSQTHSPTQTHLARVDSEVRTRNAHPVIQSNVRGKNISR